jgi:hypothetical protein
MAPWSSFFAELTQQVLRQGFCASGMLKDLSEDGTQAYDHRNETQGASHPLLYAL